MGAEAPAWAPAPELEPEHPGRQHKGQRIDVAARWRVERRMVKDLKLPGEPVTRREHSWRGGPSVDAGAVSQGAGQAPAPSSVFFMARMPCSIMAVMAGASSFGRKSAVQTRRLCPAPSAKTCADAL
jgi:hypothetical protein